MNNEQQLITLHDKAARHAHHWRLVQGFFEEVADEIIRKSPEDERLDAIAAMASVKSRLCAEEANATAEMLRLRAQIGRNPPRRGPTGTKA